MAGIRMKLKVYQVYGTAPREELGMSAVVGPENEPWSSFTPAAQLTATITNPAACGKFKVGDECIVTITPVATQDE